MSLTMRVLIALVAGLALGLVVSATGTPALVNAAKWIEPLGSLFINAIRMTVIPLVVGSLVAGIAAAPDPSSLGKVGLRAVALFLTTLFLAAIITVIVAPPILSQFTIDPAAQASLRASATQAATTTAESVRRIPGLAQWFIDLVPTNPVRAAADAAMLPLIVFTLAFGLAVAGLKGDTKTTVVNVFEAVRDAAMTLVRWILWTAPIGVFALALGLSARLGISAIGALAGYIVVVVMLTIVVGTASMYLVAAWLGRVSLRDFARAALPAQAVAFSSRSSLAALPAMIESARDRLHLPDEITSFFLPLAASIYRIGAATGQTTGVLFVAQLYGVALGPAQLATIVLTVIATSFSVPGIPGGSIVIMAPVLMSAGLPVEGIGILLGADTIPDMFRTTANVTGHLAVATAVAGKRADGQAGL